MKVTITFTTIWEPGTGSGTEKCYACTEPIYGAMQTLVMVKIPSNVGDTTFKQTKAILCEPCYNLKE